MIAFSLSAQSQTTPMTPGDKPVASPSPKYITDTITLGSYSGGTVITNQTFTKGAVFSGIGTPDPVVQDYGVGSWGNVLRSDTWYDPVRVDFVDTLTGLNLALVQKIELENPIDSEVDYVVVDVYDEFDNLLYHYLSASPEYITIDLGIPSAAYMILDDSLNTAYVVDNILLDFGDECVNTTASITETGLDTYTAPSGAVYDSTGTYYDTIPNAAGCDSIITIDLTMSFTGLEENQFGDISIFPSPTTEMITIAISDEMLDNSFRILDQAGRAVITGKLEELTNQLDVSYLQKGMYHVFIDETVSLKFVKE